MSNFTLRISCSSLQFRGIWVALIVVLMASTFSLNAQQNHLLEEIRALKGVEKVIPGEVPNTVNPFLSLTPPGTPADRMGWLNHMKAKKSAAIQSESYVNRSLVIEEVEVNNSIGQGQKLSFFGSRYSQFNQVFIEGGSGSFPGFNFRQISASEDNGSIPLADNSGIVELFDGAIIESEIGDGPVAGLSDFDMYAVTARAGWVLNIQVNTPEPFGDLDPFVAVFDGNGNLLAFNDDGIPGTFDSFLSFEVPASGTYYVSVGGFGAFVPADPFDSGSGSDTGDLGSEGTYQLLLGAFSFVDTDYYLVNLRRGDVFGADLVGAGFGGRLSIFNHRGELNVSTNLNTNVNYPAPSPLPGNGETSVAFIAPEAGWYAVNVSENFGDYVLELFVTRPAGEVNAPMEQVIFLDYNGEDFDPCAFLELPCSIPSFLTPLKEFFPAWGLPNDDATVRRITSRITDVVKENLEEDLKRSGLNRFFRVRIIGNNGLTDRTGSYEPRSVGFRKVSRVITSGTIDEAFISTIGIAQSIDLGNFRQEEDAIVLLDILSAPFSGGNANGTFSLNDVVLAPGVSKEDLVVTVLGNVISHEAGHYLGNWHNDGLSAVQCIMDEGPGGLFNLAGIGPSGVFGASDQNDVDFVTDAYSFQELFSGMENTQVNTAFALTLYPFRTYLQEINEELLGDQTDDMVRLSKTYPNPAKVSDEIMMGFTMEKEGPATVRLFDMSGKAISTLYSNDRATTGIVHQLRLNSAELNLSAGTYIYSLETKEGVVSKKLVLTK